MPRFEPVSDVVDSLCLRSGDILRKNRGLYLDVAQDVWNDLNETTLRISKRLKMPVRKEYSINKRTNSIDMECDFLKLSSVSVMDRGIIYPIYRNRNISNDIVEVPAEKNCACEHDCGYQLCNLIQGYVATQSVQSDVLPNGTPVSFNCVNRIVTDRKGVVYQENQYPKRIYTNGVWTDTILYTEQTKMCECEIDDNGCICDTEANINNVCNSCAINFNSNIGKSVSGTYMPPVGGTASCPPNPNDNEWIYYCDNKMDWFGVQCGCEPRGFRAGCANVYNIGETGNRLVFPSNFGFDKVLVSYYADIDLGELMIPYIAKQAFMKGLQYFAADSNDKKAQSAAAYGQQYSRYKWGLFLELNKYRSVELGNAISPRAKVPSYIDHRSDRWYGWY